MDVNLKRIELYQKDINAYFLAGLQHTDDSEVLQNEIRILAYHVMLHRAVLTEKSMTAAEKFMRQYDGITEHTSQLKVALLLAIEFVNFDNFVSAQVKSSWAMLTSFENPYAEAFFRLTVNHLMPKRTENPWRSAMKAMPPFQISENVTRQQMELLVLNFLMTSRLGEKWERLTAKSWFPAQLDAFREIWQVLPLQDQNAVPFVFTAYFLKHLDNGFELSGRTVELIHSIALIGHQRYDEATDDWRRAEVGLRQMMLYDVEIGWQSGH
jgi:hypothetical protein